MKLRLQAALALSLVAGLAQAAPVVKNSDFIANATRTQFNGFEFMPLVSGIYSGGMSYTEGGIKVTQKNGDAGNDIWATYNPGGLDGAKDWYPNGGDNGFTEIKLASGADFFDVGMLIGSGNSGHNTAYYQLWNDGALVLSGTVAQTRAFHYLGFAGGGFDTILLRDGPSGRLLADGTHNALALDAIEARGGSVPLPSSLALMVAALPAVGLVRRRRKA